MRVIELYQLANDYAQRGNMQMAIQLWNDCVKQDEFFGPAYLNLFNLAVEQKQDDQVLQLGQKLVNCPLTWNLYQMMPGVIQKVEEINKKRQPQPVESK